MLSQNLLNWKQAQLKVNHRLKKISKGEKGRRKKKKKQNQKKKKKKPKSLKTQVQQNLDFSAYPSKNVVKHDGSGNKSMLSRCKCLFGIYWTYFGLHPGRKSPKYCKNAFLAKSSTLMTISNKGQTSKQRTGFQYTLFCVLL